MKNEILLFENQDVKLEENSVRSFFEHTRGDGELEEKSNVQKCTFLNNWIIQLSQNMRQFKKKEIEM